MAAINSWPQSVKSIHTKPSELLNIFQCAFMSAFCILRMNILPHTGLFLDYSTHCVLDLNENRNSKMKKTLIWIHHKYLSGYKFTPQSICNI